MNGQSVCPPPLHSRVAHSFVLPQQVSKDGVVLDEEKCVYAFRDRNYPLGKITNIKQKSSNRLSP